jgi:5-methylcytosine-specific restriction endonuclease McrA
VSELLELEKSRWLAEIARRGLHERDGYLSTTSWLKATFRLSGGAAREALRVARGLEQMPHVRQAFRDGEISLPGVKVLARVREAAPEAFSRAEELLVQAARIHTVGELHRVASTWREQVMAERFDVREGRRLHASVTTGGMVRIDGDLDPEAGETLLVALSAVMDAEARSPEPETRTPAQRRADALEEICRTYLDRRDRPVVAGERPHLVLTVPYEALGDTTGVAELDRTGAVRAETARRLACDASVSRVVLGPRSEPLDVGRKTPVVTSAIRRAVIVRDHTCRFPGCDRHPAWCDAHHVIHWAQGGETRLSNLVLLCRRHHRAVHERGFTLSMDRGHPVFHRPDGSPLEDRGPP